MARQHKIITKNDQSQASGKRVYRRPVLIAHGNLRRLANAKNGKKADGAGAPRTRV